MKLADITRRLRKNRITSILVGHTPGYGDTTDDWREEIDVEMLECSKCGKEFLNKHDSSERNAQIHEEECGGSDDPKERFEVDDRVELSDFGIIRLHEDRKCGTIVGFGEDEDHGHTVEDALDHCVVVEWDDDERPTRTIAHTYIRPEGYNNE